MSSPTLAPISQGQERWMTRIGWGLSGLAILFSVVDAAMKFVQPMVVVDTTKALGWPADGASLTLLGALLLVCTILYAVPRTAVLGAILLTGYLGGAVAAHLRIYDPLFSHTLSGVYGGLLVWGGLWFRDARVRALVPLN